MTVHSCRNLLTPTPPQAMSKLRPGEPDHGGLAARLRLVLGGRRMMLLRRIDGGSSLVPGVAGVRSGSGFPGRPPSGREGGRHSTVAVLGNEGERRGNGLARGTEGGIFDAG